MVKLSNMMNYAVKRVKISLATRYPVHTAEAANTILSLLEDAGLGMERMNRREPVNQPFSADAAIELWTEGNTFTSKHGQHTGNMFLAQHAKPSVGLHVSWKTSPDFDCISNISINLYKGPFLKNQDTMVRIFERLIEEFSPAHAYIGSWSGFLRQGSAVWAAIPGIYWLNYFGKEYVDFIGRDSIMTCGWVKAEPFGEGILTWTSPNIDLPDDVRAHMEELYRSRLGAEFFKQPGGEYAEAVPPELRRIRERIVGKDPKPIPQEVIKSIVEEKLREKRRKKPSGSDG